MLSGDPSVMTKEIICSVWQDFTQTELIGFIFGSAGWRSSRAAEIFILKCRRLILKSFKLHCFQLVRKWENQIGSLDNIEVVATGEEWLWHKRETYCSIVKVVTTLEIPSPSFLLPLVKKESSSFLSLTKICFWLARFECDRHKFVQSPL